MALDCSWWNSFGLGLKLQWWLYGCNYHGKSRTQVSISEQSITWTNYLNNLYPEFSYFHKTALWRFYIYKIYILTYCFVYQKGIKPQWLDGEFRLGAPVWSGSFGHSGAKNHPASRLQQQQYGLWCGFGAAFNPSTELLHHPDTVFALPNTQLLQGHRVLHHWVGLNEGGWWESTFSAVLLNVTGLYFGLAVIMNCFYSSVELMKNLMT